MITLEATGVTTLSLPNPELGNKNILNTRSRFKFSMNGTVFSYVDTPAEDTKTYTFSNLSSQQATNFMAFVIAAAGKTVTLTWNSNVAVGKILQKDFSDSINHRKFGHSMSIEFSLDV